MPCNPAAASPYGRDADLGLMLRCITQLAPLFQTRGNSPDLAARIAASAIEAYRPEAPADYVNAARTIAFSMASIGLVTQAAAPGMALPQQMRVYGRANALNRSADQSERAMMQRRQYHQANPSPAQPAAASRGPADAASPGPAGVANGPEETAYQPDEAEIMAAVEAAIAAHRAAVEAAALDAQPPEATSKALPDDPVPPPVLSPAPAAPDAAAPAPASPSGASTAPFAPAAAPVAAAIAHDSAWVNGTAPGPRSSPMRHKLLGVSALGRVAEHARPHPA